MSIEEDLSEVQAVRPRTGATRWVTAGALAGAGAAYVFQVIGSRALGEEAFAPIGVLWTIQFLLYTVPLYGVEAYVTQSVARGHHDLPLRTIVTWLLAVAVVATAVVWAFREQLFGGHPALVPVTTAIVLVTGTFMTVRGWLAGHDRFRSYAAVTGGESVLRTVLAVPVALLVPTTTAFGWLLPSGALVLTVAWLVRERGRRQPAEHSGLVHHRPGRFMALTATGQAAQQAVLAGGPLVVAVMGAPPHAVSSFFVTVTTARIALTIAYGGLMSRALSPLTRMVEARQFPRLRRVALAVPAVAALAAAVAAAVGWWLGPAAIALLFGAGFRPEPAVVALVVGALILAAGGLGSNQLLIALRRERALAACWVAGLAAAGVALALAPGAPELRTAVAIVAGTITAVLSLTAVLEVALGRRPPRASALAARRTDA